MSWNDPTPDSDLWNDAVKLHALCQALDLVFDQIDCEPTPAKNAAGALISEIVERAQRLSDGIDAADLAATHRRQGIATASLRA
jgi:hypothetical protein